MRPQKKIKKLYRKVNTCTRWVRHNRGESFAENRRTNPTTSMAKGVERGLDYSPLYQFLLSRVGKKWDDVFSEVIPRIDKKESVYHMVAMNIESAVDDFRVGESTYWSGLFVDTDGILQKTNPDLNETTFRPSCSCCTHTFNGKVFTRKCS